MIPPSRPNLTRHALLERIHRAHPQWVLPPFFLAGIRGYYRDSMGAVGRNDRGIYDDAIFIWTPEAFAAFNANTDPSGFRPATASRKGMAVLQPGIWDVYKFDTHNGTFAHPAICQRLGPVTVDRDGTGPDTGMFGINIHRGGTRGTSSEGCQTIPPAQWDAFYNLAKSEAVRLWGNPGYKRQRITYVLLS
jgi:hypothetical protein